MAETKKTEAAAKPVANIKTTAAAGTKEEVKEAAPAKKAAAKKAPVKKAAAKKEETVKKAEAVKKAEPVKKEAPAKKVEEKAAPVKKAAAKKEAAPAKKAAAKKEEFKANIVLQYGDKNVTYDTILQNSKNNYQFEMGGNVDEITKLSVYVKPEEDAAYYVVNDKVQGRIGL